MNPVSMKTTVIFALAAVLTTAFFGFMMMSDAGHSMATCFGTTPSGNCSVLGPIEHFAAHLSAFQTFSTGIAGAAAFLGALLIALAFSLAFDHGPGGTALQYAFAREIASPVPLRLSLAHWLALHEKRDPSIA